MARRPNFGFEKRQRELERQKKKDAKAERKQAKKDDQARVEEGSIAEEIGDTEPVSLSCPYCAEPVELVIDGGGGESQEYVEDCPVCCRPWDVSVLRDLDGTWSASIRTSDE